MFLFNEVKTYFEEFTEKFERIQHDEKLDLKIMKSNGGFSVS